MRQHYVSKAMVGGLLGTLLQTIVVYGVAPMMAGQAMDVATLLERSCSSGSAGAYPERRCDLPTGVCMAIVPILLCTTGRAGYTLGRAHLARRRSRHGADAGRRGL